MREGGAGLEGCAVQEIGGGALPTRRRWRGWSKWKLVEAIGLGLVCGFFPGDEEADLWELG